MEKHYIQFMFWIEVFVLIKGEITLFPDNEEEIQLNNNLLPAINATSDQCLSSAPEFKAQYVTLVTHDVVYDVDSKTGVSVLESETQCGPGQQKYYTLIVNLQFINDRRLVGEKLRLQVTINDDGNGKVSKTVFVFPAAFNLTGSSDNAVLINSFNWTCAVTSDYPVVNWYRDNVEIGRVFGFPNGTCATQDTSSSYVYQCQRSSLTYTLTIPGSSMTEAEQGTYWRCKATLKTELDGSKYLQLNIIVPVINVTLSPGAMVTFKENQNVTFTCTPNTNANPTPVIQWYLDNVDIISQSGATPNTVTVTVDRTYHKKVIKCTAGNNGILVENSSTLDVMFPPGSGEELQITNYNNEVLYENNSTLVIYCRQRGGNPVVNITFNCGSNSGIMESTDSEAISKISLKVDRNLNNVRCNCVSTHINSYTRVTNVTFTVYYPPGVPLIGFQRQPPWKENESGTMVCNSSGGNPTSKIYQWIEGDSVISSLQTYIFTNLTKLDNGRQLYCRVNNNFTLHENVVISSSITRLDVEYNPSITLRNEVFQVIEGKNITITCRATGNPPPTVTWYRNGVVVTNGSTNISEYGIININRNMAGSYICKAVSTSTGSNVLQPDQKQLEVNVLYPPTVKVKTYNTTEGSANQMINCTADGNPDNTTIIQLEQRYMSTSIRNITLFTSRNTRLEIFNIETVSYQDTGTYICYASNGIPDRQDIYVHTGSAYMDVKAPAQYLETEYQIQGELHQNVHATIPFYSRPKTSMSGIQLRLRNGSSTSPVKESLGIRLSLMDFSVIRTFHGVDVTLPGQSVVINISSFDDSHTGNYSLIVNNSASLTAEIRIVITPSGPPEMPTNFTATGNSVSSILLSWIKGSNGGHQQTFVILFSEMNSNDVMNKTLLDELGKDETNITYAMTDLIKDTEYKFQLFSYNKKGSSSRTDSITARTLKQQKKPAQKTPESSALVGGIAGASAGILVIIVVIVVIVLYRRHSSTSHKGSEFGSNTKSNLTTANNDNDGDDDDGLRDNPLYASSQQANAGPSTEQGDPTVYASVVTPKKKNKPEMSNEPPPIYAEVQKPKKNLQEKGKKKNAKDKVKGNKKKSADSTEMEGFVYENVEDVKTNGSFAINNPQEKGTEGNAERGYRNQDGLLYVDVKFDTHPPRGRPVIRGEERTGYAMIEFEEPPNPNAPANANEILEAEGGVQCDEKI